MQSIHYQSQSKRWCLKVACNHGPVSEASADRSSVLVDINKSFNDGKVPEDFCSNHHPGTAAVPLVFKVPLHLPVIALQAWNCCKVSQTFILRHFL